MTELEAKKAYDLKVLSARLQARGLDIAEEARPGDEKRQLSYSGSDGSQSGGAD